MGYILAEVIEQMFKEVQKEFREKNKFTDEMLSKLHFIFKSPLISALDLIDHSKISHITSPSRREVYQVIGKSGLPYLCFRSSYYCSCLAYRYSVLKREEYLMCKHVLAARLSQAMGLCKEVKFSDETLSLMIAGIQ